MAPYREATASEVVEASTRDGMVRLEVAPRHMLLHVGEHIRLSVTEKFATVSGLSRRNRRRRRPLKLAGARLLVARAPTGELGIWHEPDPGVVTRLFGIRPLELLNDDAFRAAQALDQLVRRLNRALAAHAHGVTTSYEIGPGADRVLIMDFGERLVFHVRRLFRERPRRALEVHENGTIEFIETGRFKAKIRAIQCTSKFGVTAIGDYIRFADPEGEDLGSLSIPWVGPEHRAAMVELIARRIHRDAPGRDR